MFQPVSLSLTIMRNFRKSFEKNSNDQLLHDPNFIHMMKYFLQCYGKEEIQMEACWIFTNVAARTTEQTRILVDNEIIPILINLLSLNNINLVEQAIWALGNVIGDCPALRDEVLKFNIIEPIIKWIELFRTQNFPNSFVRTFAWSLVNFVRYSKQPIPIDFVQQLMPAYQTIVEEPLDEQAKIDGLWGLTYIADCGVDYIQLIIDHNIVETSIALIHTNRPKLQLCIVRLLGSIATGTDDQNERLINNQILLNIRNFLFSELKYIRRQSLWCLSNIAAGPLHHVRAFFETDLLPGIVINLTNDDLKTVREAIFTLRNLIQNCELFYIPEISRNRAIRFLFDLVSSNNLEISYLADDVLSIFFRRSMQLIRIQ
ncbi:hypothetical protein PVAND_005171 [Polypedilum vanderplanki]|uniref:Uncharacterized protein n=1 Tax=Polypedilum vanderplanki TaxID=319348 RepID=A0A9J6C016_POLVA|nr:hypothetical protein PVAND_005171 [Polypedilum vanderplanki]